MLPIVSAGLIVKNNSVNWKMLLLYTGHDGVGGRKTVAVVLGHEWLDEDGISCVVVSDRALLVSTLCMDGEAAHVVCVQAT